MKSFKTHLSLILPLLFMMLAFEFILIINASINHYEKVLNKDYNIIIASTNELSASTLKPYVPQISALNALSVDSMLSRLKNDISNANLANLEKSLPKFYSIKLENFPSQSELKNIKNNLSKLNSIVKIESFSKTYEKVHSLLVFIQFVLWFFLFIIVLLSFVLFLKQMKIWLFEHTERVEIMCLFGAPFWFRSLMLVKIVFVDCLIAFLILLLFFTQIYELDFVKAMLSALDLSLPQINFLLQLSIIFAFTLAISLFCVNVVMFRVKR